MGVLFAIIIVMWLLLACRRIAASPRGGRRRLILREIGLITGFYAALIIVLMALESWFLYHPIRFERDWMGSGELRVEDVGLTTETGERIHGWWCPVDRAEWVMLYCHGNAGNLSHRGPIIRQWQKELPISVLIIDYPGYGRSEGKPSEANCHAAARAAYSWLSDERRIDPSRLILYGKSLGAAVASDLATRRPHAALVLHSPFTSVPDMAQEIFPFFPARWLARSRYDNRARVGEYHGPLFVAHGTADEIVPFVHGRRVFDAAATTHKRFLPLEGRGHNDFMDPEFFTALRSFLAGLPSPPRP